MKKNMGNKDKLLRSLAAVIFAILYFSGAVRGPAGMILMVLAAVFLLTSFVGFCPLYTLFGITTLKKEKTD